MSCSRPAGVYVPCSWTQCHGGCPYWHNDCYPYVGYTYTIPVRTPLEKYTIDELLEEIKKRVK